MANAVQKAILKMKIGEELKEILTKSSADLVTFEDGKTLEAKVIELVASIGEKATTADLDKRISDLVNGAPEAYDTLKEIADYIESHKDVGTALNEAIANKVDKVEGKGLSTEDFTTALKEKLEGLSNYTHPETHSADMITETEDKKFMTAEEKTKLAKASSIIYSETQPADLKEGDLWVQPIVEDNTVETPGKD